MLIMKWTDNITEWIELTLYDDVRPDMLCLKNTPDIIDSNLIKKDYQILIIFGTNIPDTTGHHTAVQVPTSPNVCLCTTWEK